MPPDGTVSQHDAESLKLLHVVDVAKGVRKILPAPEAPLLYIATKSKLLVFDTRQRKLVAKVRFACYAQSSISKSHRVPALYRNFRLLGYLSTSLGQVPTDCACRCPISTSFWTRKCFQWTITDYLRRYPGRPRWFCWHPSRRLKSP